MDWCVDPRVDGALALAEAEVVAPIGGTPPVEGDARLPRVAGSDGSEGYRRRAAR